MYPSNHFSNEIIILNLETLRHGIRTEWQAPWTWTRNEIDLISVRMHSSWKPNSIRIMSASALENHTASLPTVNSEHCMQSDCGSTRQRCSLLLRLLKPDSYSGPSQGSYRAAMEQKLCLQSPPCTITTATGRSDDNVILFYFTFTSPPPPFFFFILLLFT